MLLPQQLVNNTQDTGGLTCPRRPRQNQMRDITLLNTRSQGVQGIIIPVYITQFLRSVFLQPNLLHGAQLLYCSTDYENIFYENIFYDLYFIILPSYKQKKGDRLQQILSVPLLLSGFNSIMKYLFFYQHKMPIISYKANPKQSAMTSADLYYIDQFQLESQANFYMPFHHACQAITMDQNLAYVDPNVAYQGAVLKNSPTKNKVKTSLCKKWAEFGTCPYLHKCQFAHGIQQLRCNVDENSYKTKECIAFFKKGYCPYGYRCNFSHKAVEKTEESSVGNYKQRRSTLIGYQELFETYKRTQGRSRIQNCMGPNIDEAEIKSIGSTQDCRSESLSKSRLQNQFFQNSFEATNNYLWQVEPVQEEQVEEQIQIDGSIEDEKSLLLFNIDHFY